MATGSRNILITGGSSGLGLALAAPLLQRGDQVTLVARDPAKLERAVAQLVTQVPSARVHALPLDVSGPEVEPGMKRAVETMGGLDLLIHSAGILREGYVENLSERDYRETLEINYFGALRTIRALLPALKASGRGQIVNVASVAALTGVFGYTAYCSSKYALLGLSEALRVELQPQRIKVQVVCPPEFDSPMVDAIEAQRSPENRAHALSIPKLSVQTVAAATLEGLDSPRFMIVPGARARGVTLALRFFPGIGRWVADRTIRAVYRGPASARVAPD